MNNTKQLWSVNEENEIIDKLYNNINIENIAKLHNRSINAVNARIKIIYSLHKNNIDICKLREKLRSLKIKLQK